MAGKKHRDNEVTCEILEIYGELSDGKVYARVSWNNGTPRDEIRRCWKDKKTGELKLGKGIDLDDDELEKLEKLRKKKKRPVNFDQIFRDSTGIMKSREDGFQTIDGFKILRRI